MEHTQKFLFGLFLFIIPIIIIILLYGFYTYNICKYNNDCAKKKFMKNFDVVNKYFNQKLNHTIYPQELEENPKEELIEGFFSGLTDWFYGSTPNNLNNDFPNEVKVEKPLNKNDESNKIKSPVLSPDEMKDSDNKDLLMSLSNNKNKVEEEIKKNLNNIQNNTLSKSDNTIPKSYVEQSNKTASIPLAFEQNSKITTNQFNPNLQYSLKNQAATIPKINGTEKFTSTNNLSEECSDEETNISNNSSSSIPSSASSILGLGQCNFYHDSCPSNFKELGNFTINGMENNMSLNCGNVQNTKPARAIATIKNNTVFDIVVIDKGQGFNPSKPPKIKIVGGKGNGAEAEAVIDDDGYLKIIKVIHPGYNYTNTPNVMIEPPLMNSSCHLCCKL